MLEKIRGRFPCPLCSRPLHVRITKTDKPYFMCNSCGVQLFVRYQRGIDRLKRLLTS